ncbi:MAG: molybdenum ABC transporter ATP-binding protein [Amaricoccus sp.]
MTLEVAVRHDFGGFRLDAAFAAPSGVTALFGPSGSGKTSMIDAIAGLLTPDFGRIAVDGALLLDTAAGVDVPAHRRRVGYVFQEPRLFPHLSVRHNLVFGRWFARDRASPAEVARIVGLLGIGHLLARRPAGLSGGEKQRVAIGRALLAGPRILLMDEPLAALDAARKDEILPYIERLRDEVRIPILYVSHSVAEVARLATTVVALAAGRVVRSGPAAAALSDPAVFPAAERDEAGVILTARLAGHDPDDGLSELVLDGGRLVVPRVEAPPGARLRVRIRARDVMVALARPGAISALNVLPVRFEAVLRDDGAMAEVALRLAEGERLIARITRRSLRSLGLLPGTPCFALIKTVAVGRLDLGVFDERDA